MDELEVSRATLKRDLVKLRDSFNAPLVFDRDAGGYRFGTPNSGPSFELPGLWFSPEEILALMSMYQMLEGTDESGLLGRHIKPLMTRLQALLDAADGSANEILKRVKLIAVQRRRVEPKVFETIGAALVKRLRLVIRYYGRAKDRHTEREVSPLRLVNYKGNWYLDAWCHQSDGIRMFSLDSIEAAKLTDQKAKEVSLKTVDEELGGGYGIYRGKDLQWATLVFNKDAAKWVRSENWNEQQKGRELDGGQVRAEGAVQRSGGTRAGDPAARGERRGDGAGEPADADREAAGRRGEASMPAGLEVATAKKKRGEPRAPRLSHNVYVVELALDVLADRRFEGGTRATSKASRACTSG